MSWCKYVVENKNNILCALAHPYSEFGNCVNENLCSNCTFKSSFCIFLNPKITIYRNIGMINGGFVAQKGYCKLKEKELMSIDDCKECIAKNTASA